MGLLKSWIWKSVYWRLRGERGAHDEIFRGNCQVNFRVQPRIASRKLDKVQVQALAMAPSDAVVAVEERNGEIHLLVTASVYVPGQNIFVLKVDPVTTELYLYIDYIKFEGGPSGLGAIAFLRCAQMCVMLGIGRVDLLAAGGASYKIQGTWNSGFNGFYTWARFGFNASLHQQTIVNLQRNPALADCQDLLEIMERNPTWWKDHGAGGEMTFDLRSGSRSWQTLSNYLSKEGLLK